MFKGILREHLMNRYTWRCTCGEFVLESSTAGVEPYIEHLNKMLMESMPWQVTDYWDYIEGK